MELAPRRPCVCVEEDTNSMSGFVSCLSPFSASKISQKSRIVPTFSSSVLVWLQDEQISFVADLISYKMHEVNKTKLPKN